MQVGLPISQHCHCDNFCMLLKQKPNFASKRAVDWHTHDIDKWRDLSVPLLHNQTNYRCRTQTPHMSLTTLRKGKCGLGSVLNDAATLKTAMVGALDASVRACVCGRTRMCQRPRENNVESSK